MRSFTNSDTNGEQPRPSFWFPSLEAVIVGVMIAGILNGGRVAFISLVVLMPLAFLISGVYAMVIMPKFARTQVERQGRQTRKIVRSQVRGAIMGVLLAVMLAIVITVVILVAPRRAPGEGEELITVVAGSLISAVVTFVVTRIAQMRGIERWREFLSDESANAAK